MNSVVEIMNSAFKIIDFVLDGERLKAQADRERRSSVFTPFSEIFTQFHSLFTPFSLHFSSI